MEGKETPPALSQHRAVTWALVLGLCLLMLSGVAARAQTDLPGKEFESGQVVVELRDAGNSAAANKARLKKINDEYGTTTRESIAGTGVYLLTVSANSNVAQTVRRMTGDPRLRYAEPNYVIHPFEGEARHRAWGEGDAGPSYLENAASALNLSIAHDISGTLGEGVTVAVVDTGVQLDHPALAASFEGIKRYDFVDDDPNPSDIAVGADDDKDGLKDELVGHGTHVAGIVGFVAPAAKIMPLRALDTEGFGDSFTIAEAIYYATDNGADVINLSLGSPSRSRLLESVAGTAIEHGALVAAAAGNSNTARPHYPAAGTRVAAPSGGLVAVTSVDKYGWKSDYANYGRWVDIAAPGESIRSAVPISKYAYWSGTSMATPFVSGEAALILDKVDGSLDPAAVAERIRCSARPIVGMDQPYTGMLGAGYADVGRSLAPRACDPTAPPETTITAARWGWTNDTSATFAFSSSKAGSSFECKLDADAYASCSSPKSYTGLADGQHTFEVRATDVAGNTDSTPVSRTWNVDTTAPEAPVVNSPPQNSLTNTGDITVSGTAEAGSTVELFEQTMSLGKSSVGQDDNWSIGLAGVSDGEHLYEVRATDAAGNTSSASNAVRVIVDTAAPAVTGVTPHDGAAGVALTDNLEATFSEDMDPATLNQNTFTLVEQGSATPIEATVTYDRVTKRATLNPDTDLQADATYTATVNTCAEDAAGNPLATYTVWSFTTATSMS